MATKRRRLARSSRIPRDMRPVSASVAVTTVGERPGRGGTEVRGGMCPHPPPQDGMLIREPWGGHLAGSALSWGGPASCLTPQMCLF